MNVQKEVVRIATDESQPRQKSRHFRHCLEHARSCSRQNSHFQSVHDKASRRTAVLRVRANIEVGRRPRIDARRPGARPLSNSTLKRRNGNSPNGRDVRGTADIPMTRQEVMDSQRPQSPRYLAQPIHGSHSINYSRSRGEGCPRIGPDFTGASPQWSPTPPSRLKKILRCRARKLLYRPLVSSAGRRRHCGYSSVT